VLGALGQAGNLVLAKQAFALGPVNSIVASTIRVGVSAAILLPLATISGHYRNPLRVFGRDRRALILVLAGSVVGPYLGITLSLLAVAYTQVGVAATLMAMVPVVMLPISRVLTGERVTWRASVGATAAVAGVGCLFLS
jgi:drug/metabolite transporter (DMT)-like permease